MIRLPLIDLKEHLSLVFHFSVLQLKLKYKGTSLGLFWTAVEPLLMFVILYVVFTGIRIERQEYFAIYLIIGVMLLHLFTRGTMSGLIVLVNNTSILNSINIKKEFFPAVSVNVVLIQLLVEMSVFFALMPIFNFVPSWTIILLPLVMVLFLGLILGLTYFLSIAYVYFRDLQPIWGVFSYSLIFICPVFWYVDSVEGILLDIHKINPLGQILELGHKIVFGTIPPFEEWLHVSIFVGLILFVGFTLFNKLENKIVERL